MDPWWTDPTTGKPEAQPVGPKTVTVNILPDALPCKPKRRRSQTVVMSKPFQEPPYWLAVDEATAAARAPIEESPFHFTVPVAPRKRRPIRSAIRVVVPSFISVSCAGLIVALTLQAMNPPKPALVAAKPQAVEAPVAAQPPAAELPVVAKPPAVEPSAPVVVNAQAVEPPVVAKPQAAEATIVVEPPAAEVAIVVEPPAPVLVKPQAVEPAKPPAAEVTVQDTYGTSIHFVENTKIAGEEAKARKKLMLVLNISGNFEDSGFT